jgi:predicted  nucleic acid-binding Zn-ribbon protein
MKLIMSSQYTHQRCNICQKIEVKQRRIGRLEEKIRRWRVEAERWRAEAERWRASIERTERDIHELRAQIN